MCTAFVSIEPTEPVPVLLLAVRDEYAGRRWAPPGHHWPAHPTAVGGLDLAAGGTWLAVEPGTAGTAGAGRTAAGAVGTGAAAACLLNGFGTMAPARARLSRGELPLTALRDGGLAGVDLERYDPFHLVLAGPAGARVLSWGGSALAERALPSGLSVVLNDGLEGLAADRTTSELVRSLMAARAAHFRARFEAAARPAPTPGPDTTEQAWGGWLPIVSGDGLALDDPAALVQRREFGDGRIWGSSSVSLLAFGPDGVRYDFGPAPVTEPGAPGDGWRRIG
ncbi:NRDE family protein [Kitasatospora sp. NPDC091207]|uniref:NRDE family protein n=1 Tax=Kitasatospora sp. NPDC091207 TaxID=3364083 RepID=UPI00380A14C3